MQIKNPYAPVEELKVPLFENKGLHLFIKREDLSHPFISGNKWRKLKYHLIDARKNNKTELVTFGGAYSNHLLATAAAGAKYQFRTTGFVRGEEIVNPVLQLCEWFGMRLKFVSRSNYKEKKNLYDLHFGTDPNACFIDEGGAGENGEAGVRELLDDLSEPYDIIACSVGTGCTFKALVEGVLNKHWPTQVYGISILKGVYSLESLVQHIPQNYWQLFHQFHEGGYAKTNPELLAFIKLFASQTGVLLDQVYEGKMMLALHKLASEDFFKSGTRILVLHNGGLTGMLSLLG